MVISTAEYASRVQARRAQLYRLAYCYVKNQQDALDIVSEAVYRGLTRLHQLREPAQFELWLNRIVINTALDHLRKHRCEELQQEPPAPAPFSPEDTMDLYRALELLSPEDRGYVILRFFEGRSFREMSYILDVPESTIKSRVYRILKQLRQQLST